MVFGAVVGFAKLVACGPYRELYALAQEARVDYVWLERHEHTEGPDCWVLRDIRRLPRPVPMAGHLGLFRPPVEFAERWLTWLNDHPVAA
jgi:hypothetical protein